LKFTTKAQVEIVGLAIIVVIVVILLLFFSLKSANSGISDKMQTLSAETAQAFLESVMHKKTDCGPYLENIIKNCYGENDNCGGACEYAKNRLKENLESNFGEKKQLYHFVIEKDNVKKIELSSENSKCGKTIERSGAGIMALPDFPGIITVELELC
jgi:hypothetical protein